MLASGSYVHMTGVFWFKALTDYNFAVEVCAMQPNGNPAQRRTKWSTVFGTPFPT